MNQIIPMQAANKQTSDKLLTIQKVGNGYILSDISGGHNVCENGNEVDLLYAVQRYFGFQAIEPQPTDEGDSSTKLLSADTV